MPRQNSVNLRQGVRGGVERHTTAWLWRILRGASGCACLAARNALQPVDGPRPVPVQGLELPTGPSRQDDIDVPQGRVERRRIEPTLVVDPAPDVRVEHPRQIVQRLVTALMKGPAAHRLTDRLESFGADGRTERDADLPSPSARQPRPESIAEKVELPVGIVPTSVIILAIDDFRLLGMKCQSAFSKPVLKRDAQSRSLLLTATVTDRVVGVTLEGNARMVPVHPHIKRVVQKKICKDGAYNPALWRPSFPHGEATIRHLHGGFQPSLDVQQHPWTVRMFTDCPHQQSRLDTVKRQGFLMPLSRTGKPACPVTSRSPIRPIHCSAAALRSPRSAACREPMASCS